jgi:hypothetical protein
MNDEVSMTYDTLGDAIAAWEHGSLWTGVKQSLVDVVLPLVEAKRGTITRWRIQNAHKAIVGEADGAMVMWVESTHLYLRDELAGTVPRGTGFDLYFGDKAEQASPGEEVGTAYCAFSPGIHQPIGSLSMTCETEIFAELTG